MHDGVRIAVTLHMPMLVEPPWPVVFEARPYRKDDLSDATGIYHRLCEEGGLAVCRADVRGTGTSEGIAVDEYTEREWQDHLAPIAWLAEQPWSNGNVGMFGTSYSGFNSLQVAALQPPALKAIIPIYATDRRYTDDVHFGGGVRRCLDFLDYPLMMTAMNALPPVPSLFGDGWREEWLRRIDANDPWELRWFEEQDEGPYWRHGSVWYEGYERIRAATLIIAGHADGYRNMALRGLERLTNAPAAKVLFGPWSHMSPRSSLPGPRIDHVPEMIRWWRRWLADEDNGADREPQVRIFVREPTTPHARLDAFRGAWRAESAWPPATASSMTLDLGDAAAPNGDVLAVRGDVGVSGSIWCAADLPFGTPWDQREDESRSLIFGWRLDGEVTIVGRPQVELRVTPSTPVAFVSAKLCAVHPDGASELITRTIVNLTHRDGHDRVAALVPGEPITVAADLDATAFGCRQAPCSGSTSQAAISPPAGRHRSRGRSPSTPHRRDSPSRSSVRRTSRSPSSPPATTYPTSPTTWSGRCATTWRARRDGSRSTTGAVASSGATWLCATGTTARSASTAPTRPTPGQPAGSSSSSNGRTRTWQPRRAARSGPTPSAGTSTSRSRCARTDR
jgi:predicted acyl esterase